MTSAKRNPRAFFLAVVLMGTLVVGTIVGYFLLLPRAIPKQVMVAVLPFDAIPQIPSYLTHTFPQHLNEVLALSRETTIIDFEASKEALEIGEDFRGFALELGATHVVDGEYVTTSENADSWSLTIRLIDVSHPVWKLKWDQEFHFPTESLLAIRNEAVEGISKGLYDNSFKVLSSDLSLQESFESYLTAQMYFDDERRSLATDALSPLDAFANNSYAQYLFAKLFPERANEFLDKAIEADANHYPSLIQKAWARYVAYGDLVRYVNDITELAGRFPNSVAVKKLAELYHALGWFEQERELLYRWVRMRPRSGEAALMFARSWFRSANTERTIESLRIAEFRDPGNELVHETKALFEIEVLSNPPPSVLGPAFLIRTLALKGKTDEAESLLHDTRDQWSCDQLVEFALYIQNLDFAFENIECGSRFWTMPPSWWSESDPRWQHFITDERYLQWLSHRGFSNAQVELLEPTSIARLFAPIRRILPESKNNQNSS